jgi:uncharacterized protein YgiM (DUF1202 family)
MATAREFFCCGFFLPRPTLKNSLIAFQPLTVPSTRIVCEYTPQYPNPLSVAAGESVRVGREDDEFPGWKWCRASSGLEGWVPVELLSDASATETAVLCDYSSRELAVQPGEEVTVEDSRHEWLLVRNKQGERGWISASHADFVEEKRPTRS